MDDFPFSASSSHVTSSSSASWGAKTFLFEGDNIFRFSICVFERHSNYFNVQSFDADIDSIGEFFLLCKEKRMELESGWVSAFKDEISSFLTYDPGYTSENQYSPPPGKSSEWYELANKALLISLFSEGGWKSKAVESLLKSLANNKEQTLHIFFSHFLNENKFFVTILDGGTYEELELVDRFDITVQDIFYNSLLTYSEEF